MQKITCAICRGFCGEMYARADVKHGIHFKRPYRKCLSNKKESVDDDVKDTKHRLMSTKVSPQD